MEWLLPLLIGAVFGWLARRPKPIQIKHLWKGPAWQDPTWRKVNLTRDMSERPLVQMNKNLKTAFPDLTQEQQARIGIFAYWWCCENTKNDALQMEVSLEHVVQTMEEGRLDPIMIEGMKGLRDALTQLANIASQGQAYVVDSK